MTANSKEHEERHFVIRSAFHLRNEFQIMLQLKKPLEYIEKVLGKQEYIANYHYRKSVFQLYLTVDKGVLLFQNLTKELLLLTNEEYVSLSNDEKSPLYQELVKKRFFVPDETDEVTICEQIRSLTRLVDQNKPVTRYNILPTTACNARCFYCFEAGAKPLNMTEKTAEDVAAYIIRKCEGREVYLCWFGGEPTCNIKAIDIISKRLQAADIEYSSMMVSNAYLFDEEMVQRAKTDWKLRRVQITLDGVQETYNRIKSYVYDDPNPFARVIRNIDLLCKQGIVVQLRMNLGAHNGDDLQELAILLKDRFVQYKNFVPYVTIIYEDVGYEKTKYSDQQRAELSEKRKALYQYFDSSGFEARAKNFEAVKTTSCQADSKDWVMILPDGRLGFCEHNVDSDTYGSIYDDPGKPVWCGYKKPEEKCKTCAAYPSCLILEKCPAGNHECYEHNQYSRLDNLYAGMKQTYERYLKKAGSDAKDSANN